MDPRFYIVFLWAVLVCSASLSAASSRCSELTSPPRPARSDLDRDHGLDHH